MDGLGRRHRGGWCGFWSWRSPLTQFTLRSLWIAVRSCELNKDKKNAPIHWIYLKKGPMTPFLKPDLSNLVQLTRDVLSCGK